MRKDIQATRLVIITDSGVARTPALRPNAPIQLTWLSTTLLLAISGNSVDAVIALAKAKPMAV
jgi:hypothetical protein